MAQLRNRHADSYKRSVRKSIEKKGVLSDYGQKWNCGDVIMANSSIQKHTKGLKPKKGEMQVRLVRGCSGIVSPFGPSPVCDGLTLASCQVPNKPLYHSSSSAGQGRENMMKGLWVKIRTGRSLSNYHHRRNRLDLGKLI